MSVYRNRTVSYFVNPLTVRTLQRIGIVNMRFFLHEFYFREFHFRFQNFEIIDNEQFLENISYCLPMWQYWFWNHMMSKHNVIAVQIKSCDKQRKCIYTDFTLQVKIPQTYLFGFHSFYIHSFFSISLLLRLLKKTFQFA